LITDKKYLIERDQVNKKNLIFCLAPYKIFLKSSLNKIRNLLSLISEAGAVSERDGRVPQPPGEAARAATLSFLRTRQSSGICSTLE
jgi:hypothetical protein